MKSSDSITTTTKFIKETFPYSVHISKIEMENEVVGVSVKWVGNVSNKELHKRMFEGKMTHIMNKVNQTDAVKGSYLFLPKNELTAHIGIWDNEEKKKGFYKFVLGIKMKELLDAQKVVADVMESIISLDEEFFDKSITKKMHEESNHKETQMIQNI